MDKNQKTLRCPLCATKVAATLMKRHILEKHGLHYTKWHESLPDDPDDGDWDGAIQDGDKHLED